MIELKYKCFSIYLEQTIYIIRNVFVELNIPGKQISDLLTVQKINYASSNAQSEVVNIFLSKLDLVCYFPYSFSIHVTGRSPVLSLVWWLTSNESPKLTFTVKFAI